jgi:hypothetical protein
MKQGMDGSQKTIVVVVVVLLMFLEAEIADAIEHFIGPFS